MRTSATLWALMLAGGVRAAAPVPATSVYTSIEHCRFLRRDAESGSSEEICGGAGGMQVRRQEDDSRQDLAVAVDGKSPRWLELGRYAGDGFSTLGNTIEWRGRGQGGAFRPTALLVRFRVQGAADSTRATSLLIVTRLQPVPCVTALVRAGPAQNATARALADAPGHCLLPPGTATR